MTNAGRENSQALLVPSQLSDAEFIRAFEELRISNTAFHHRDHVRLAWGYLGQFPLATASEKMAESIQHFAMHHAGNLDKYHETVTRGWMLLVQAAILEKGRGLEFDDFVRSSPQLLDLKALNAYYSPERLNSPEARRAWVEPDIRSLP